MAGVGAMSVRVGPWSHNRGVPVEVQSREEMADAAIGALRRTGSREWMIASGDTLVIANDNAVLTVLDIAAR